ncbi:AraC family transcriptional regulator [Dyella tabacisoli]|uniref:AraC family transcriptional regulator n=1 Tax=Dyella tabacisoli TaxID=2282381 RepID=A0A369UVZ1_9GAMM|nr:AraC family transcriptional regulator [Dyella tabacisoli]RDD83760.1 AraC family transcriptional regulator [Dyella tabacisoli]
MHHQVRYRQTQLDGQMAMLASSARAFPRHTHDQYGIGVVDAGGHASAGDAGPVEAGPGSLIFVNPGEVHDGWAVGGAPRTWRMLYFDPALLLDVLADIGEGQSLPFSFAAAVATDHRLRSLFDAAFADAITGGSTLASEAALFQLAAYLPGIKAPHASARVPIRESGVVRRAKERIHADLAASLSLAQLASDAGLSRFQLLRHFSRELGLPPHAYLLQQRIAMARRMILRGLPLAEVAAAVGFVDQSHLTRHFSRQMGVSPGRYATG